MCSLLKLLESLVCRSRVKVIFKHGLIKDQIKPVGKFPQYRRRIEGSAFVMTTMKTGQFVPITLEFTDDKGKIVQPDGPPQWATDNSDVLTLTPSDDGMTCTISSTGMPGTAKVQMTADGEFGPGISTIVGTEDFTIVPRPATQVKLTVGEPQDIAE